MHHDFTNAVFAGSTFILFALCSPAFGRAPCPPSISVQPDITSAIPCRRADSDLIEFITDVNIPRSDGFVAMQHFIEGRPARELQITWMGSNFRHHFLAKVEPQVGSQVLEVYRLQEPANDQAILDRMGSNDPIASLHDLWVLLSNQSHGEPGPLRADGIPNVLYVRDDAGRSWAVDSVWSGAGWEVGASRLNSVTRQRGTHILAR